MKVFLIALYFAIGLAMNSTFAKVEYKPKSNSEAGLTVGTFLPWGLPGVRDQYRFWGFNFFYPTNVWDLEYEVLNGRGQEVTYYTGSVGGRLDYSIFQELDVFVNFGIAYHYYKRKPSVARSYPYRSGGGIYLGFGGFFDITERFKLRGEVKFHTSPGKSLYVGVGPSYVF